MLHVKNRHTFHMICRPAAYRPPESNTAESVVQNFEKQWEGCPCSPLLKQQHVGAESNIGDLLQASRPKRLIWKLLALESAEQPQVTCFLFLLPQVQPDLAVQRPVQTHFHHHIFDGSRISQNHQETLICCRVRCVIYLGVPALKAFSTAVSVQPAERRMTSTWFTHVRGSLAEREELQRWATMKIGNCLNPNQFVACTCNLVIMYVFTTQNCSASAVFEIRT